MSDERDEANTSVAKPKPAKKSTVSPVPGLSKNETINVFMFVISSPLRIVGAVVLGIFAMFFGIFVYPGNEKIQTAVLKRFDDPSPVVQSGRNPVAEAPKTDIAPATPPTAASLMSAPSASPTNRHPNVKAALRAFWPDASDQRIQEVLDFYARRNPISVLLVSGNTGYFAEGGFPNIVSARELVTERCFIYFGRLCFIVAENGDAVLPLDKQSWKASDTARISYAGRFDVALIPGLRTTEANMNAVNAYAKALWPNRTLVIDPNGNAFAALSEPSEKDAEVKAFAECEANTSFRPKLCVLYASGDRVVLGQRILAPRR